MSDCPAIGDVLDDFDEDKIMFQFKERKYLLEILIEVREILRRSKSEGSEDCDLKICIIKDDLLRFFPLFVNIIDNDELRNETIRTSFIWCCFLGSCNIFSFLLNYIDPSKLDSLIANDDIIAYIAFTGVEYHSALDVNNIKVIVKTKSTRVCIDFLYRIFCSDKISLSVKSRMISKNKHLLILRHIFKSYKDDKKFIMYLINNARGLASCAEDEGLKVCDILVQFITDNLLVEYHEELKKSGILVYTELDSTILHKLNCGTLQNPNFETLKIIIEDLCSDKSAYLPSTDKLCIFDILVKAHCHDLFTVAEQCGYYSGLLAKDMSTKGVRVWGEIAEASYSVSFLGAVCHTVLDNSAIRADLMKFLAADKFEPNNDSISRIIEVLITFVPSSIGLTHNIETGSITHLIVSNALKARKALLLKKVLLIIFRDLLKGSSIDSEVYLKRLAESDSAINIDSNIGDSSHIPEGLWLPPDVTDEERSSIAALCRFFSIGRIDCKDPTAKVIIKYFTHNFLDDVQQMKDSNSLRIKKEHVIKFVEQNDLV